MINVYAIPKGAAGHTLTSLSMFTILQPLRQKMESSIYSSLTFTTARSHLHFIFFLTLQVIYKCQNKTGPGSVQARLLKEQHSLI